MCMPFKKGNIPVNSFPKGVYQGHGFKNGNKLGFKKGHNRNSGENNPRFKGRILRAGYWLVFKPNHPFCNKGKRVQEHRLIMEEHLGRHLTKKECIHHINEIKSDNRLENLMVFPDSASHTRYHALCRTENKTQSPTHSDTKPCPACMEMGD